MTTWLIQPDVLAAIAEAKRNGYQPTGEERAAYAAAVIATLPAPVASSGDGDSPRLPRIMKVTGKTATIQIDGALTEKPDCMAMLFGGGNCTYVDIRRSLAAAEADPEVTEIVFEVNSPGGTIDGLFETLAAIQGTTKPIRSRASLAASAAYAIVAVAGPIEATTPAAAFGSIGVAISMHVSKDVVDIASTDAPHKRPDVSTPEGVAVVQERLDAIHELFADAIAHGRADTTADGKIDVAHVNANFGRGGVFLAAEAKKRKMIDSAPKPAYRARATKTASAEIGGALSEQVEYMNKEQLKAAHPELFAAVLEDGRVEGRTEGQTKERKRVSAHLKLGETTGAMKIATDYIVAGASVLDEEVHAAYMSAGLSQRDRVSRQADSDAAGAAADGAKTVASGGAIVAEDQGDAVTDLMFGKSDVKGSK